MLARLCRLYVALWHHGQLSHLSRHELCGSIPITGFRPGALTAESAVNSDVRKISSRGWR